MKLEKHFNQFIKNISLDESRKTRIASSLSHLSSFLKENDEIKNVLIEFYTQGSYAINTCIKPSNGDEFDVDSVVVLNGSRLSEEYQNPNNLIEWLVTQLKTDSIFGSKVKRHNRCVRIDYEGDFHLDIVPSLPYYTGDSIIQVPDRKIENWILSNPKGYVEWCQSIKQESNFNFSKIVRMLKYWRDVSFGKSSKPSSILFTTLIGLHFGFSQESTAEILIETMNNIKSFTDLFELIPTISNPSLQSENLARDWTNEDFTLFKKRLTTAVEKCINALEENDDKEKSIEIWKEVFPAFPSHLPEEAKAINKARREQKLYVDKTGVLAIGLKDKKDYTPVSNHRNYGN